MEQEKQKQFEKVMNIMVNSILEKNKTEYKTRIEKAMEEYGSRLLQPDTFNIAIQYPEDEFQETLIDTLLDSERTANNESYGTEEFYRIREVYIHSYLFESQLDELIDEQEGMVCSSDKMSFLLRSYINYLKTGTIPTFDRTKFWVPNFGSEKLWMSFIQSIPNLVQHGTKEFICSRETLIKDIESDKKEKEEKQEKLFKQHPNFVDTKLEKDRTIYIFQAVEKESIQHVELHIIPTKTNGYTLAEQDLKTNEWTRLSHSAEKSKWVEELLNEL